jgi:hypothetical protein
VPGPLRGPGRFAEPPRERGRLWLPRAGKAPHCAGEPPPHPPRWPDGAYSVEGAAAAVGVRMGTVYTWVRTGRIPGAQITKGMPWKLPLTEAQLLSLKE